MSLLDPRLEAAIREAGHINGMPLLERDTRPPARCRQCDDVLTVLTATGNGLCRWCDRYARHAPRVTTRLPWADHGPPEPDAVDRAVAAGYGIVAEYGER